MSDRWEVMRVPGSLMRDTHAMPEGWEPFAASTEGIWLRRRVIPAVTKPIPHGVLSAKELAEIQRQQVRNYE